ncbi:hypothetical protein BD779DRAFT_302885 [Infundibulicybe gibba]|nr:hypothetical protein BD779DRAFT_302885 [Infundibulicybe gibba]
MVGVTPPRNKAPGRGKQPKRFLGNNDALELALLIGGEHEQRAKNKTDKRHQTADAVAPKNPRNPKSSASKSKVKLKHCLQRRKPISKKPKRKNAGSVKG